MTKRFVDQTWQQEYLLLVCSREEAARKLGVEMSLDIDGMALQLDTGAIALWTSQDAAEDVLVHECVHAGMFTLDRAGVERIDTETLAYVVQAIWRRCKKFLDRESKR